MPAKFIVTKGRSGKFGFTLEAANGSTIIKSSPYETKREALTALRYIQRNGDTEMVDDRTVDAPVPTRVQAPARKVLARKAPTSRTVAKKGPARRMAVRGTASAKSATAKAPPRKAVSKKTGTKPATTRKAVSKTAASRKRTPAKSRA